MPRSMLKYPGKKRLPMKKKTMYKLQHKLKKVKKGKRQEMFDIGFEKEIDSDLFDICKI